MSRAKNALFLVLTFAVTLLLLWGFAEISARVPNEAIYDNMIRSAESYKNVNAFEFDGTKRLNAISDNYADAITLGIAWNMGEYGAIDTKYNSGGEYGVNAGMYLSLVNQEKPDTDYTRYWHGNAAIARIYHTFTDVSGMKRSEFLKILALAIFAAAILIKKRCPRTAISFLLALACVQIWNVRLALEYQPVFVVALFICILFLIFEKRGDRAMLMLSVISGVMTAFFDFLTTETLPILLPLILVISMRMEQGRGKSLKANIIFCAKCCICFAVAYVGAFAAKWIIASVLSGENKIISALSSAEVRFGAEEGATFLSGIPANLTVLFGGKTRIEPIRAIIGTALSLAVLGSMFYLMYKKNCDSEGIITLLLLGAVVFVRFAVLQNHSYLHEFFTYRAFASTICALFACVLLASKEKKHGV